MRCSLSRLLKCPLSTAKTIKTLVLVLLVLVSSILAVAGRSKIVVSNDIHSLYSMSEGLLEGESTVSKVINHGASGCYFLVGSTSPSALMEEESSLTLRLNSAIASGALKGYMAVSSYILAPSMQLLSYKATVSLGEEAYTQYLNTGYTKEEALSYASDYKRILAKGQEPLVLGENIPKGIEALLSSFIVGQVGDKWYSIVLPSFVKDEGALRSIAKEFQGVSFVNKAHDIGVSLDKLTSLMLALYAISLVLVGVLLCLVYKKREVAFIAVVPLVVTLVSVAYGAVTSSPWGFFSVTALALVFGLGLDYIIYITEELRGRSRGESSTATAKAINLSFITTLLSFGTLALSHFAPISIFSRTVLVALSTAFLVAKCLKR